jgi:hypothetical protein
MRLAAEATADAQEVIASLDGDLTLREVIAATGDRLGLSDEELDRLGNEAVDLVVLLIELGALEVER